jgi:hypothetical protein
MFSAGLAVLIAALAFESDGPLSLHQLRTVVAVKRLGSGMILYACLRFLLPSGAP